MLPARESQTGLSHHAPSRPSSDGHTGQRPERAHDGKVIILRRNLRWSADGFEIACARTVLAQLEVWIEDYNEEHPRKGLRMHSPREFICSIGNVVCPV